MIPSFKMHETWKFVEKKSKFSYWEIDSIVSYLCDYSKRSTYLMFVNINHYSNKDRMIDEKQRKRWQNADDMKIGQLENYLFVLKFEIVLCALIFHIENFQSTEKFMSKIICCKLCCVNRNRERERQRIKRIVQINTQCTLHTQGSHKY